MASLILTAETLVGTPGAGQTEFNGTIFTGAPTATTRGIIPTEQFYRLNANLVGANATGAQKVFGVGVTLVASMVYEFEIVYILTKSVGATSHTVSADIGGTATINNFVDFIEYGTAFSAIPLGTTGNIAFTNSVSLVITAPVASAAFTLGVYRKGTVSINAGGTFTPQYSLSAAPGGAYSTVAGSYMKIKPIGVSGANTSVGTWA
jgi:hypothetical protein